MSPIGAEIGSVPSDMELRASINSGRQGAFSDWTGFVTPFDYQPVKENFEVLADETVNTYAQTGVEAKRRNVKNSTDMIVGADDGGTVWDAGMNAHPLHKGEIWVNPVTKVKYVGK